MNEKTFTITLTEEEFGMIITEVIDRHLKLKKEKNHEEETKLENLGKKLMASYMDGKKENEHV